MVERGVSVNLDKIIFRDLISRENKNSFEMNIVNLKKSQTKNNDNILFKIKKQDIFTKKLSNENKSSFTPKYSRNNYHLDDNSKMSFNRIEDKQTLPDNTLYKSIEYIVEPKVNFQELRETKKKFKFLNQNFQKFFGNPDHTLSEEANLKLISDCKKKKKQNFNILSDLLVEYVGSKSYKKPKPVTEKVIFSPIKSINDNGLNRGFKRNVIVKNSDHKKSLKIPYISERKNKGFRLSVENSNKLIEKNNLCELDQIVLPSINNKKIKNLITEVEIPLKKKRIWFKVFNKELNLVTDFNSIILEKETKNDLDNRKIDFYKGFDTKDLSPWAVNEKEDSILA